MSYWSCVVKARAPSLLLWGTLQVGIIYTIYNQKKRAEIASLGGHRFTWRSHIPAPQLNTGYF